MTNDLLNQDMEFDAGAVDTIDQSSVEGGGPSYPVVQWVYGNIKEKKHGGMDYLGGFFVKSDTVDADTMAAAGWTKTTRTFESGADEEGYWKRDAAFAIIAERRRWEVAGDNGPRQVFLWGKYDAAKAAAPSGKAPSGRNQYLVLVKGLEDAGPFVLTMKGAAAQAFESYRDGKAVLSRFSNSVIRAANNASDVAAKKNGKPTGKRWPFRAFWLPVGAARDAQGEPTYIEVGKTDKSKVVIPMALGLPDKPEAVELKKYYVGNVLLDRVNELYEASAAWREAWDNLTPGQVEGEAATAGEATAVAQAVHDAGTAAAEALGL